MFLPGFQWCQTRQGVLVLAWLTAPSTAYAFVQKGDGSVEVRHTPVFLEAKTMLVDPDNWILVPDVMLAWAKSIIAMEHRMTLAYASGMVASNISPEGFTMDSPPLAEPPAPHKTGPIVLGGGAWGMPES